MEEEMLPRGTLADCVRQPQCRGALGELHVGGLDIKSDWQAQPRAHPGDSILYPFWRTAQVR
jgi:hypothetical protein